MVKYDAVEAYGNPILPDNHDGRVEAFREVAEATKRHGSLLVAQLSHPGRQGSAALNPHPVSASDVQLKISWAGNSFAKPRALTVEEIKDIVREWGETAYLCWQAGFDGVQVHCVSLPFHIDVPTNGISLIALGPRLLASAVPVPYHERAHRRIWR
jgi:2,4-dienoyl-CoA reductase-like NADH-dependent reductase (Old Yellow Enzyme family)